MPLDLGYHSTTRPDSLSAAASDTATTLTLADGSTMPDPAVTGKPYTVILGYGSSREEVVTVTGKPTATTLQVSRGQDGTPATAKNVGDIVVHGVSAREFVELMGKLDRAGGTMTGPLLLAADPTDPLEAATKQYADKSLKRVVVPLSGSATGYQTAGTDYVYVCSATLTLTLPSASVVPGQMATVKNAGTGVVTVASASMIDGAPTFVVGVQHQSIDLVSTGAVWVVV